MTAPEERDGVERPDDAADKVTTDVVAPGGHHSAGQSENDVAGSWVAIDPRQVPRGRIGADDGAADRDSNASPTGSQATTRRSGLETMFEGPDGHPEEPPSSFESLDEEIASVLQSDESKPTSPSTTAAVGDATATERGSVPLQRRQELERHLRSNPADKESYLELAEIYRQQGRPVEAKRVLGRAIELFPDDADVRWMHEEAILSRSLQQLREVRDLANRLQTVDSQRELKRSVDDWALRRIEVCQARLARDPSLVHLNLAFAEAYYDAEEFSEAIEVATRVVDQDSLAPTAYLIIGRSQMALGHDLEAMASLRACAMRRAVPAPINIRRTALQLLCEISERLAIERTQRRYREALTALDSDSQNATAAPA